MVGVEASAFAPAAFPPGTPSSTKATIAKMENALDKASCLLTDGTLACMSLVPGK